MWFVYVASMCLLSTFLAYVLGIVNLITPFKIPQPYPSSFRVTWSFTIQSGVSFEISCRTVEGCSYTCLHRFNYVHVYHAGMQLNHAGHATIPGASTGTGGGLGLDEPTLLVCN